MIHRRANGTTGLRFLAEELRDALHRAAISPPYVLAAHSFGALVARQFAALYSKDIRGIVFVDGLPLAARIPLAKAIATVRFAQLLARFGLVGTVLPLAAKRIQAVAWALAELNKLPGNDQILAEWNRPEVYGAAAGLLAALPRNLRAARKLRVPAHIPVLSLYSDYPDPAGRRVGNAGHWIQVDQPNAVAGAIREIARHPDCLVV